MSNSISSFPQRTHINANTSFVEQVKKCFDGITRYVIDIFKKIGEFFYNLFHTKKPSPPFQAEVLQPLNENLPGPVVQNSRTPLPDPQNPIAIQQEEEELVAADKNEPLEPKIANPVVYTPPWVDPIILTSMYSAVPPLNRGFSPQYVLSLDDTKLDFGDNWMWMFPTCTLNTDIPTGPVLSEENLKTMLKDPIIRENILKVFKHILAYLGLQLNDENNIEKAPNFDVKAKYWITYNNHNYRRIGRIIHSLVDMHLYGDLSPDHESYGKKFVKCLEKIFHDNEAQIGSEIYNHWCEIAFC